MDALAIAGLSAGVILLVVAIAAVAAVTRRVLAHNVELRDELDVQRAERLDLERELSRSRRRPLLGELVLVNTPKPDDQSIRGVVTHELDGGGLVLVGAVYLERDRGRGGEEVREVPAGEVVVPSYAFAQIVTATAPTPASASRVEVD